jgi:hypothetical protein
MLLNVTIKVHPELLRLPSTSLKGTFLQAYILLNEICNRIGWDDLLKHRSVVFVMEEEYRIHRAIQEEEEKRGSIAGFEDKDDEFQGHPNAPPMPEGGTSSDDDDFHDVSEPDAENQESTSSIDHLDELSISVPDAKERDDFSPIEVEEELVETSFSPASSPFRDEPKVSPTRREEFDIVDFEDVASSPPKAEESILSPPQKCAGVESDTKIPSPEVIESDISAIDTHSTRDDFSPVDMDNIAIESDEASPVSTKSDDTIGKSLQIDETLKILNLETDNSPLPTSTSNGKEKECVSIDAANNVSPLSTGASPLPNRQSVSYNNFRRYLF